AVQSKLFANGSRMMRTKIERVDAAAGALDILRHERMGAMHEVFIVKTEANAALVRRNADEKAGAIEQPNRLDRPRKPLHVLDAAEIADVVNQRTVAV